MNKDLKEFLKSFNEKKVDYMIVGGFAVAYYGYPRYTGDIDVWIKKTKENAQKIVEIVKSFGFSDIDLSDHDFLEDNMVFQFGVEPNRIDIITDLDGLRFDEAEKNKQKVSIDDVSVYIISLADLKKNKKLSGRYKDLDDIENLP
ncbi:MAG: nucleotidyltransferase [candidate division WOR-3 bacterium]